MKIFLWMVLAIGTSTCYADEWIPYTPSPPQVFIPQSPAMTYSTYVQPVVYYQWFPQTVYQPIVVDRGCFFLRKRYIEYVPVTQWVYLPVVK